MILPFVQTAHAHVKWFVETEEILAHETVQFALDEPFVLLWIAVIGLTITVTVLLDLLLPGPPKKFLQWAKKAEPTVLRIFEVVVGINLLVEGFLNAVIAPPFVADTAFTFGLIIFQVIIGLFLLGGFLVRWAALGLLILYFASMIPFGVWPLMDELFMVGVAFYMFLMRSKNDKSAKKYVVYAIPLLRVFTGLALVILAFSEKLFHPELGLEFLKTHQWNFMQMIGFEKFTDLMFVFSAGAMELLFGAILILGAITRINIIVTAVFFTITFFLLPITELIGHLPIFVTALVLAIYGAGDKWRFPTFLQKVLRGK